MKIGDQVAVIAEPIVTSDDIGTVKAFELGRIFVHFPDGWERYYQFHELRVIEAKAEGAAS
jgi:hypothetical protein